MAQTFNTHLPEVAFRYAGLLGLRVTETTMKRDLVESPHYPSLLSLSDTFDRYGIPNAAYRLEAEKLGEISPPFIAFLSTHGNLTDFVLVTAMTDDQVRFVYRGSRTEKLSRQEFVKRYHEIVWLAEPGASGIPPGEKDYEKKRSEERTARIKKGSGVALITLALLMIAAWDLGLFSGVVMGGAGMAAFLSLLVTKVAGLSLAVLLLLYETGSGGDFVRNICQAGVQTDCGAVLGSKAASVGGVTWSEAGLCYFATTLSGLLFPGVPFAEKAWWLCWGGFLAVLYTPFSLYYQWRVVKQWCPLCLRIQAVLVMEAVWSAIVYGDLAPAPSVPTLAAVAICAVWPVAALAVIKPLLIRVRDAEQYRGAYKRLRANPDLFEGLLRQQPQSPEAGAGVGILLGNPDAPIRIIKVCNPYCGPCAKAHPVLAEILDRNRNIQLRIVFSTGEAPDDRRAVAVRHFMTLAARNEPGLIERALNDWYGAPEKDYPVFLGKYPLKEGEGARALAEIAAMNEWCKQAEIAYTPTIFVNGYRLPEDYGAEDLREIL